MQAYVQRLSLLIVICLALVAGSASAADSPTVTLLIYGSDEDLLQLSLDRFTEKHGIEVEVIGSVNWTEHYEKGLTMTAGGIAPDVLYGEGGLITQFAAGTVTRSLEDFVARDQVDLSGVPPAVLGFFRRHQGELHGIPTAVSIHNAYYNPAMYDEAGLPPPPTDWAGDEWLWDDFVDTMRRLTRDTNADGVPDIYGTNDWGRHAGSNHLGLWDLALFDETGTKFLGDSPEVIAAFERMIALRRDYNVVGGSFTSGTAATRIVQSSYLNTLIQQEGLFEWRVGAMPKGSNRATQAGFHGIGISRFSRNPDLAWKLVKWLTLDPEGATLFNRAENRVPINPAARNDFVERFSQMLDPESLMAIIDGPAYIPVIPRPIVPVDAILQEQQTAPKLFSGEISVRSWLEGAAPAIRATLSQAESH